MHKLFTIPLLLTLSGCAAPILLTGLGVGSVAVTETTGKTITDNTVSAVSGQDCRVSRVFKSQTVCQDEIPQSKFQVVTTKVTPSSVEEIESKYK